MDTETWATTAVKRRIAETKYLLQSISERDKNESWDGVIIAFSNEKKTKDSLVGEVPVQIKGRKKNTIKNDTINFRIDKADLVNYRNRGGTILFVVYITNSGEEKIYYSKLTPYLLNEILANQKNEKKPNVKLSTLPEGSDNFCRIIFNFINEMERQKMIRDDHNWTLEEITEKFGPENIDFKFTLSGSQCDMSNPFTFVDSDDFFIHASLKETDISFPVQHVDYVEAISCSSKAIIELGKKKYLEKIEMKQYRDGKMILSIGNGFNIIKENDKTTLKYHPSGDLDERIRQIKLLINIVDNSGLKINGKEIITINPTKEEMSCFVREEQIGELRKHIIIKKTLEKLNVNKPFYYESITEKEQYLLSLIIDGILFGKILSLKDVDVPVVSFLKIANLNLLLCFEQLENGLYRVEDFFAADMKCMIDEIEATPTSKYSLLKSTHFLNCDNMNLRDVLKDFKSIKNKKHLECLTLSVNELIKAYDEDNSRNDLLDVAIDLTSWLRKIEPENSMHILNYYQCVLRIRSLSNNEKQTLTKMILKHDMMDDGMAGAYILLGDTAMAETLINRLSEEERQFFYNLPIFNLMKK